MGFWSKTKGAFKVLMEATKIDLYEKYSELQDKNIALKEEIDNLKKENSKLIQKLKIKEEIVFEYNAYWLKYEAGKTKDGPFCSKCYDSDEKLIRLISCADPKYSKCPICKIALTIADGKPWKREPIEKEKKTPDDYKY